MAQEAKDFIDVLNTDPGGVKLTDIQRQAIIFLVANLKSAGIFSKTVALYPFIGGTAFKHKWNLINLLDTDAAYRLTFTGGIAHSVNGIQGNGSSAFADTFITTSTFSPTNFHGCVFVTTNTTLTSEFEFCWGTGAAQGIYINARYSTSNATYAMSNANINLAGVTDSRGFHLINRTSATAGYAMRNDNYLGAVGSWSGTNPSGNLFLLQGAGGNSRSANNLALVSFGTSLTTTESFEFQRIALEYQSILGRNPFYT